MTFHGEQQLKDSLLSHLATMREQGRFVQGSIAYWENGHGCAVGCAIAEGAKEITHSDGPLQQYERLFGIPAGVVAAQELIFESLPLAEAELWPERFVTAIPVGADLSGVPEALSSWLESEGVKNLAKCTSSMWREQITLNGFIRTHALENPPTAVQYVNAEAMSDKLVELLSGVSAAQLVATG